MAVRAFWRVLLDKLIKQFESDLKAKIDGADAGYGKFDIVDGKVDSDANTRAGVLYENLKSLEEELVNRVRDQFSL